MKKTKRKNKRPIIKLLLLTILVVVVALGFKGYDLYSDIQMPNVKLQNNDSEFIYIPSGSYYTDVLEILKNSKILVNEESFKWVAEKKKYPNNVKAGKYRVKNNMSNNQLVNLLRSGNQTPVKLVFNKIRTKDKFAGIIANQIEADSAEILNLLNDEAFLGGYEKNSTTAFCMLIPNTYEFFWNTDAIDFIKRMAKEHKRFWNDERMKKAEKLGLSPNEVYTLASIVEEETIKNDEKQRLAGVYYNRLKKRIRLGADPTVRFALNDFNIKRVLNKHLTYDSPYNTYKYYGLPPGPICIPSISSIDAVLNLEKHSYLYFCAKDDFSGYHAFAKTLQQHNANARKYHRFLNKNRIYR